jgi:hypothetical protein
MITTLIGLALTGLAFVLMIYFLVLELDPVRLAFRRLYSPMVLHKPSAAAKEKLPAPEMSSAWKAPRKIRKISLLVPYRETNSVERTMNWAWLQEYYKENMQEAFELIIGTNNEIPFCKSAAVNDAFKRSSGDIIVILDADCFIDTCTISTLADRIRAARHSNRKLWFIPYRRFYRLSAPATDELLMSDPHDPMKFADPPPAYDLDHTHGISFGHWYGALIQIMPREAFVDGGGMDERMKGWGGEDISFLHAIDTMFGRHKTFDGPVYHMWHPTIAGVWQQTRQWEGQERPEMNDHLTTQYTLSTGDKLRMRELLDSRYADDDDL